MLAGVIFDMDGVLIDSHPVHRRAWRQFLATVGKSVSPDQLDFIEEGRRREEILRHFLGDLPPQVVAEFGQRKDHFFEENFDNVQVIPGIPDFLERLHAAGMPAGIATSASASRTWSTLERLKIGDKFVTVVTGDDVDAGKPDPAVYRLAANRMQLRPETLMVLEDAPSGVQAARSAGMHCIGVASNGKSDMLIQAGAEHIIPDFVNLSVEKIRTLWTSMSQNQRVPSPSPV
jgi:HAD superfamily hydrolase (TIGR01509 family)